MKVLSPYFVEFDKNKSILAKKYSKDYKIGGSNQKPIIIITYYENTFSVNDWY